MKKDTFDTPSYSIASSETEVSFATNPCSLDGQKENFPLSLPRLFRILGIYNFVYRNMMIKPIRIFTT